jgi:hypothetical protein
MMHGKRTKKLQEMATESIWSAKMREKIEPFHCDALAERILEGY